MNNKNQSNVSRNIQYLIAVLFFVYVISYALLNTTDNPQYGLIFADSTLLVEGFLSTLAISLVTLICSMIIGFILFLMLQSPVPIVRAFSRVFNELVMGTPLLLMVFLSVYVFGIALNIQSKLFLGVLALTLYMSPYLANAYQTAVAVVDEDQYTIMKLYGFNLYQRYAYVILPQMIKPLIPSLINNLSSIIKGSALLKIVSITEISYVITVISNKNWAVVEGYYVMWLMYIAITIPLSLLAQYIGKKVS